MSKFWSQGSDDDSSSSESRVSSLGFQDDEEDDDDDDEIDPTEDPNVAWERLPESAKVFRDVPQCSSADTGCTRIVCMSDTHDKHRDVVLPPGDILIHGGDFSKSGEVGSIQDLNTYFRNSGFEHVVCIAGNHDVTLQPLFYQHNWERFHPRGPLDCEKATKALQDCIYLEDESCTVNGLEFYGSPWSPTFFDWAFNAKRGDEIRRLWDAIPTSTDILITHGPPLGRGDWVESNGRAGCYDLLLAVQQRIQPRLHVFGHIHESYGVTFDGTTLFVNASNLNLAYQAVNLPIVLDVPNDKALSVRVVQPECTIQSAHDFVQWIQAKKEYQQLAYYVQNISEKAFPTGTAIFSAYETLCEDLLLHRDRIAANQLHAVIAEIYAESFGQKKTVSKEEYDGRMAANQLR
jgi:Icc-related predicted phosphoesterase